MMTDHIADVKFRLRRLGRDEWLSDDATPTDNRARAATFASPVEAVMFAATHLEEPKLWHWEDFPALVAR